MRKKINSIEFFLKLALDEKEEADWLQCTPGLDRMQGNYLSWEAVSLNMSGLDILEMDQSDVCPKDINKKYFHFKYKKNFEDTMKLCKNFGTQIATIDSREKFEEIVRDLEDVCTYIFTGYRLKQNYNGPTWVNVNTGDGLQFVNWEVDEPDIETGYDCAVVNIVTGKMTSEKCHYTNCAVCEGNLSLPAFQLRGVCKHVVMDRFFIMTNTDQLLGFLQTKMIYSHQKSRWEIVHIHDNKTVLAHTVDDVVFPLGKIKWKFNKTENCTDPDSGQVRSLVLHREVSQPGTFCCDDGDCLDSQLVCDNFPHCRDRSDEDNCNTLRPPPASYNRDRPPVDHHGILDLYVNFTVVKLFDINEEKFNFDLLHIVDVEWYDKYLYFEFLKPSKEANTLTKTALSKIWVPDVMVSYVEDIVTAEDPAVHIVKSQAQPELLSGLEDVSVREFYSGADHSLNLRRQSRNKFSCSFDKMKDYPFDTQNCSILLYLPVKDSERARLVGVSLKNLENLEFSQYLVDWKYGSGYDARTEKDVLTVSLILSRKFMKIFMVSYLPTILMNIINQATNYIRGETKYDMIITVNITCMMVLASVYLSVSSSLPVTSDIKPVEVWLLFNLAYPVLVIITNVALEVHFSSTL